jgi:hypothetical protein
MGTGSGKHSRQNHQDNDFSIDEENDYERKSNTKSFGIEFLGCLYSLDAQITTNTFFGTKDLSLVTHQRNSTNCETYDDFNNPWLDYWFRFRIFKPDLKLIMFANIKRLGWLFTLITIWIPNTVFAASGMPNSPYFGYGARAYLDGENTQAAIYEAGNFNLDWIALDFDWQEMQPEADTSPNWSQLDAAMAAAADSQISVLISITQVPAWAMGENGPRKGKTVELASKLVNRYPETLLALELFPAANTIQGWGTQPDPGAYVNLLKATSEAVGQGVLMVAGGLTPVQSPSEGINDIEFLRQLYAEGTVEIMPIISVRLPAIGNDPLTPLHGSEGDTLRHYETIHNTMLENGHNSGLIWVTGFAWDSSKFGSSQEQADWLNQAYLLMRSQLYIGAAFFDGLNRSETDPLALLFPSGTHHLSFEKLAQLIAIDDNGQSIQVSLGLQKKLADKNFAKGR